ncbi:MAG: hypothetical protein RL095_477 [Verrucomicrobiota bacterium]|jgi:hypothetical protein
MQFNGLQVKRLSCDKITLIAACPAFSGSEGLSFAENVAKEWQPFGSSGLPSPHYMFGRSVHGIALNWGKETKLHKRVLENEYCDLSSGCKKKQVADIHQKTAFNLRIEFNPNKSSLSLVRDFFDAAYPERCSITSPVKVSRFDSALDYHDPIDIRFIDSSALRNGSIYFTGPRPETLYLGSSAAGGRLLRCYDKRREQIARGNQWLSGSVLEGSISERYSHPLASQMSAAGRGLAVVNGEIANVPFDYDDDAATTACDDPEAVDGLSGIDHWWRIEMQDRRECCFSKLKSHYVDTFNDVFAYDMPLGDQELVKSLMLTGRKKVSDSDLALILFAANALVIGNQHHHFRYLLDLLDEKRRLSVQRLLRQWHKTDFIGGYFRSNCVDMFIETEKHLSPLLKHFHPLSLMGISAS